LIEQWRGNLLEVLIFAKEKERHRMARGRALVGAVSRRSWQQVGQRSAEV
jgi:hypothetical protein